MPRCTGPSMCTTIWCLLVGMVVLCGCSGVAQEGAVPTHSEAAIRAFNAWLGAHSTTPPLLEAVATDSMGLGLAVATGTTKRIRKGSLLLELPLSATLARESGASYGHLLAGETEEQYVVDALLVEYALGPASIHHPWIAVLPTLEGMQTPFMWTDAEQASIEPRSIRQMVAGIARHVKDGYHRATRTGGVFPTLQSYVAAARKQHLTSVPEEGGDRSLPSQFPSDAWSFDRYAWAHALVDTRAWNLEGKKMLVPGADFFNHDEDDDDRAYDFTKFVYARSQKFLTYHQLATVPRRSPPTATVATTTARSKGSATPVRVLRVLSDRDAGPAGSPLYESYGDNTNDIYFAYHGFLPGRNARDCQKLLLSRGVQPFERAAMGTATEGLLAQLRGHVKDVWSQSVCVHRDEYPPLLEMVGWLVAVGRMSGVGPRTAVQQCISARWRRWQAVAPPGYRRDASLLKQLRSCTAMDAVVQGPTAVADVAGYVRLVNMSHRVQHAIVMANAKAEFSTLKTDEETAALRLDTPSGDQLPLDAADVPRLLEEASVRRRTLTMRLRLERKEILRTLLGRIRMSQNESVSAAAGAAGAGSVGSMQQGRESMDDKQPHNSDL